MKIILWEYDQRLPGEIILNLKNAESPSSIKMVNLEFLSGNFKFHYFVEGGRFFMINSDFTSTVTEPNETSTCPLFVTFKNSKIIKLKTAKYLSIKLLKFVCVRDNPEKLQKSAAKSAATQPSKVRRSKSFTKISQKSSIAGSRGSSYTCKTQNTLEITNERQSIYTSIGKGFGEGYRRSEIFECPFWFEMAEV